MRTLLFMLALHAVPACAQGTKVLFIGNSYVYSNDLPNTLRLLAQSLGQEMTVASSAPGGYQLYEHATYEPTLSAITSEAWDFVVMQEQSQLGALPPEVTNTEIGAVQLTAAIEANNECTFPVFFMTWGRENGDALNCPSFPFMCTYAGMQLGLHDNYLALAEYNDGYVAPVGEAWRVVRNAHPGIDLYVDDGSHPSPAGTYLAACVFYCTLFGTSVEAATYSAGLDEETAATLRSVASSTVLDATTTWNLDVPSGTDAYFTSTSGTGPNEVTYHHPGMGTHLWTCTNGQSSTGADATFTFLTSGTYTITHTYDDPCGNSDVASWNIQVMGVGIGEGAPNGLLILADPGGITVFGGQGQELLLSDIRGRLVRTERIHRDRARLALGPGAYAYRIGGASGKVLIEE